MPSLAHLSPNHCHSLSCRSFLRQRKAKVRNVSNRYHDPCGSHEKWPNHEKSPITRDLSQTIHLLQTTKTLQPFEWMLAKELMTTHYMADAMLCMWSKYLGHGKGWSESENNTRQKQKDRERDVNRISQRQPLLCATLKGRYLWQSCAKTCSSNLLKGLHNNLSQAQK